MPNPVLVWDTTVGQFETELFLDTMPITASNFVDLAKTGFYTGVCCLFVRLFDRWLGGWLVGWLLGFYGGWVGW